MPTVSGTALREHCVRPPVNIAKISRSADSGVTPRRRLVIICSTKRKKALTAQPKSREGTLTLII